ncbi:hypothetical protein D0Z00_000495 [Geotrichum galactomycetum]|uniref:Uncharacterized protein n=1 Tax=Geotrichum galactomycetum TaxID=27317 RepID=A0ACB6V9T7_9ASCO|nr:hypothetical protein D0Z00_000495 [Geotrichum candidum]
MADEPNPAPVKRRPTRRRLHGGQAKKQTTPPVARPMTNHEDDDFFSLTNPVEEQKAKAVAEEIINSEIAKITKTTPTMSSSDLNDDEPAEEAGTASRESESKKRSISPATDTNSNFPEEIPTKKTHRPTKQPKLESADPLSDKSHDEDDDAIEELEVKVRDPELEDSEEVVSVTKETVEELIAAATVVVDEEEEEEDVSSKEIENIDPEFAERIRQRKAQLKALKENSFPVGIVIKSLLPGLETIPPFVSPQTSATTFGVIKQLYMASIRKYFDKDFVGLRYARENSVLIWSNTIVFDVATPHSVGVKRSQPSMLLYAMLKEDYEKNRQAELEAKLVQEDNIDYDELLNQEEEKLLAASRAALLQEQQSSKEVEEGYFTIHLKGKDNTVVSVQVNAETAISKLVDYYRKQRTIDPSIKIRLSFDDEDMDLSQTVGDTELEEDFTIDVFLD